MPFVIGFIVILYCAHIRADIDCVGDDDVCKDQTLNCPNNGSDCIVNCTGGFGACEGTIVNCPNDGSDCILDCNGPFACADMTIS